jgi:hypothetical protein
MTVEHEMGLGAAKRHHELVINIVAMLKQVDACHHYGGLTPAQAFGKNALTRCQTGRHSSSSHADPDRRRDWPDMGRRRARR